MTSPDSPIKNEKFEQAIIEELSEKMKNAGYTVLGKNILPWALSSILGLIIVIYGFLISSDKAAALDIKNLQGEHTVLSIELQNMATNIYLLCQAQKTVTCIKPENQIK